MDDRAIDGLMMNGWIVMDGWMDRWMHRCIR